MYINHYTLNSGHNHKSERSNVDDATLAIVSEWIDKNINADWVPLPANQLAHYSAKIISAEGSLMMTVMGPLGPHVPGMPANAKLPLVTFGVAHRSRHSDSIWQALIGAKQGVEFALNIKQPATPWLGVIVYQTVIMHKESLDWLADFERCCAWAWITRNPNIEAIK